MKKLGLLFATVTMFGFASSAYALEFTASDSYGTGTSGLYLAAGGSPIELSIPTIDFSVPPDIITSAVLSITGYNAYSQQGSVYADYANVNLTDLLLGALQGNHNQTSTTTFSNGNFLTFFQGGWSQNGVLGIDITAGNKDFWLSSYCLTIDYTDPCDPTPTPEPGTIALFGLGLAGLVVYGKHRQNKA